MCYYRPAKVAICTPCKRAIRPENIYGHLVSGRHWGNERVSKRPSKKVITAKLDEFDFISSDEAVALPPGPLAPFPFLQLLPDDAPPHRRAELGWYCLGHLESGAPCLYCCATRKTMLSHIYELHSAEKYNSCLKSTSLYRKGHVQRFFTNTAGSSYFRVDPTLSGVVADSDFDVWYRSLTESERRFTLSSEALTGDGEDGRAEDVSPFLAKVGWTGQLEGYSRLSLIKLTRPPPAHEKSYLHRVAKLSQAYFRKVSQADVTRLVHPVNLSTFNNWKK